MMTAISSIPLNTEQGAYIKSATFLIDCRAMKCILLSWKWLLTCPERNCRSTLSCSEC